MKKVIIAMAVLLCVFSLCSCETEETGITTVETPYCELTLPEDYAGNVEHKVVSEEPYTVEFSTTDGTSLFSLSFGGETENLIGTIVGEKENTVVYAAFAELDEADSNYEELLRYQNGINTIIEHLVSDSGLVANEIIEYEDTSTFEIKTSVTTLFYPNKWKDIVKIENTDEQVKFSYNGEKLFDLVFTECDGYLLGTYKDTPIYIISYNVDESKYTEEEYYDICGMENSVNVILENLMKDENFIINE